MCCELHQPPSLYFEQSVRKLLDATCMALNRGVNLLQHVLIVFETVSSLLILSGVANSYPHSAWLSQL